jgi:hypothetical protein
MTRLYKLTFIFGLGIILAVGARQTRLWASVPGEQVKLTIDKVMEVLRDPTLRGDSKKLQRREQLQQIVLPGLTSPKWRSGRWEVTGTAIPTSNASS